MFLERAISHPKSGNVDTYGVMTVIYTVFKGACLSLSRSLLNILQIAFVMPVIEKFTEFLNTLTMKCLINTVVMILICASLSFILFSEYILRSYLKN